MVSMKKKYGGNPDVLATYYAWTNMRSRCNNAKVKGYENYGGRGITVCERWSRFKNFMADMGVRPPGMTLERKDNDKGYSPENCIWASRREQALNRRRTVWIEYEGIRLCAKDWAGRLGASLPNFRARAETRGWDYVAAIKSYATQPIGASRKGVKLINPRKAKRRS